jgi:hypothetical protein
MTEPISREHAEHYLRDISPMWRAFWFHMHLYVRNLDEFCEGLKGIDDNIYEYHEKGHKHDMARWVREVIGDGTLADEMEKVKTRDEVIRVVCDRVEELKGALGGEG